MDTVITELLAGRGGNRLLPFFWQHGEDEKTLRSYMRVIQESGCRAVCVESRPHPDFCGDKWWADMDIILDEARTRGMQVWILDDAHFPTGYANGALQDAPASLCRQSVHYHIVKPRGTVTDLHKYIAPMVVKHPNPLFRLFLRGKPARIFDDDTLLSVTAYGQNGETVDLTDSVQNGILHWQRPPGDWTLVVCALSRNAGAHRDYINMLSPESCQALITAVYEPHFARYAADFGKTIAGFFSDEPELGNGVLYPQNNRLGTMQDLPWSAELEAALASRLGAGWRSEISLLWKNDGDAAKTARLRYAYMDCVTRIVQSSFSAPLGGWCRAHGVQYIGHSIEDDGQHARTGSGLGHYFRGLAGQDWAGVDCIGGQVLPQGEDVPVKAGFGQPRDGAFYHYALGKLAASAAAIEPLKQSRAMCEIFGNYGWGCGVQLQKYLADHFLVRGINAFVPHAFSPKPYPDRDCPPHFYAQGHNPQLRHFGTLMGYMNRASALIIGGKPVCPAAILYHAEAEWTGISMPIQAPARALYDAQIDYLFLPQDVFAAPEAFNAVLDSGLSVNGCRFEALVVPYAQFVTSAFAKAAAALAASGFPVVFADGLPDGLCDSAEPLPTALRACTVVPLGGLAAHMRGLGLQHVALESASNRVRVLRYEAENARYMLVNEAAEVYNGSVILPNAGACYAYDAWENVIFAVDARIVDGGTAVALSLEPRKSLFIVFDSPPEGLQPRQRERGNAVPLQKWTRALCAAVKYPSFSAAKPVNVPDALAAEQPAFSGFARYQTCFEGDTAREWLLEITDAAEGVEVFVNGKSAGVQIVPCYRFDITTFVQNGRNALAIEVATTLERERFAAQKGLVSRLLAKKPSGGSGLTGAVRLYAAGEGEVAT